MADFVKVANINEFISTPIRKAVVNGKEIVLCKHEDKFYATSAICPHQGGPLDEGTLENGCVVCPWHGWVFNVKDGSCQLNPSVRIETYEAKVEGNDLLLRI